MESMYNNDSSIESAVLQRKKSSSTVNLEKTEAKNPTGLAEDPTKAKADKSDTLKKVNLIRGIGLIEAVGITIGSIIGSGKNLLHIFLLLQLKKFTS
jgi:hypothetical protein